MPHCIALKNDFAPCTSHVHAEGMTCGIHMRVHERRVARAGPPPVDRCVAYLTTGRWCNRPCVEGQRLCVTHDARRQLIQERVNRANMIRNRARAVWRRNPRPTWRAFMDEIVEDVTLPTDDRYEIANRYYVMTNGAVGLDMLHFITRWEWVIRGRQGPEPIEIPLLGFVMGAAPPLVPRHEVPLGRIARDGQNVHTQAVSAQTNDATDKLLAIAVPATQQTERQMTIAWLSAPHVSNFGQYLRVMADVHRWFTVNTCRQENDHLYRHVLRGLVAHIERQPDETRQELFKRLWEECLESVGMCCEGHISRLCNVMVGFDESFKPPISLGEVLQNKMSAIAALDVPTEMKITHATAVFDELGIPSEQRVAWLEAF